MSTRACIAYIERPEDESADRWRGVYSHFDGYPTGLGAKLWDVIRTQFLFNTGHTGVANSGAVENALTSFIAVYIKGHPAGWSVFDDVCYCHDPDFVLRDGVRDGLITSEAPDPLFIEYV